VEERPFQGRVKVKSDLRGAQARSSTEFSAAETLNRNQFESRDTGRRAFDLIKDGCAVESGPFRSALESKAIYAALKRRSSTEFSAETLKRNQFKGRVIISDADESF
jgi:hypothetical protein